LGKGILKPVSSAGLSGRSAVSCGKFSTSYFRMKCDAETARLPRMDCPNIEKPLLYGDCLDSTAQ